MFARVFGGRADCWCVTRSDTRQQPSNQVKTKFLCWVLFGIATTTCLFLSTFNFRSNTHVYIQPKAHPDVISRKGKLTAATDSMKFTNLNKAFPQLLGKKALELRKERGQYHWFSGDKRTNSTNKRAYFLRVIYDGRLRSYKRVCLRTSLTSFYNITTLPLYAVAWFPHRVVICNCTLDGLPNSLDYVQYRKFNVRCLLPRNAQKKPPLYFSLTHFPYNKPTNFLKLDMIVESEGSNLEVNRSSTRDSSRRIGVCGMNIYGHFGLEQALYFVNWMEALLMFGVHDVTWNNMEVTFDHPLGEKVFGYYTDRRRLIMHHYKPLTFHHDSPSEKGTDNGIANSHTINHMVLNECIYSHLQTDWFTLVLDLDEILVPLEGSRTYQEFLLNLSKSNISVESYTNIGACSKPFYKTAPKDTTQPKYLPLFRLNRHGFVNDPCKTFRNTKTCAAALIHRCVSTCDDILDTRNVRSSFLCPQNLKRRRKHPKKHGKLYRSVLHLPTDQLANYHYRSSCKEDVVSNCTDERLHMKLDNYFYDTFGQELKKRVEAVFETLGLDYDNL